MVSRTRKHGYIMRSVYIPNNNILYGCIIDASDEEHKSKESSEWCV